MNANKYFKGVWTKLVGQVQWNQREKRNGRENWRVVSRPFVCIRGYEILAVRNHLSLLWLPEQ
jgi:hypothetical protein